MFASYCLKKGNLFLSFQKITEYFFLKLTFTRETIYISNVFFLKTHNVNYKEIITNIR